MRNADAVIKAALVLAGIVAGGWLSPAQAAGELPGAGRAMVISPASGNNFVSPTIQLSAPCAPGSTLFFALLYGGAAGHQMPVDGQLMSNIPTPDPSTGTAFSFQTGFRFQDTAEAAGRATLGGSYVVEVRCTDEFGNVKNRFTAPVDFISSTVYTATTSPPVVVTPLSLGTPALSGPARVDSPLTCAATSSGATSTSYSWKRDGAAIAGATSATRAPVGADLGKMLSCSVTATGSGGPKTTTSAAVKVALGVAPAATTKPAVAGTAKVGKKLTARIGTWSPAASTYVTKWLRDGKAIKGATARTYRLSGADRGRLVTVQVIARMPYHLAGKAVAKAVRVR